MIEELFALGQVGSVAGELPQKVADLEPRRVGQSGLVSIELADRFVRFALAHDREMGDGRHRQFRSVRITRQN